MADVNTFMIPGRNVTFMYLNTIKSISRLPLAKLARNCNYQSSIGPSLTPILRGFEGPPKKPVTGPAVLLSGQWSLSLPAPPLG